MANAKDKYTAYREQIEQRLEGTKRAKIELNVKRDGGKISITAKAESVKGKDSDPEKEKPVLRLVLTEETVRYGGGNGIRYHHHVVRGFPGGTAGKALVDGKVEASEMILLEEVKKGIDEYIAQFEKTAPFPVDPPAVELKGLSVVAFVQDDADKSVWHAVSVEVPE
jgi:hypothetical protein